MAVKEPRESAWQNGAGRRREGKTNDKGQGRRRRGKHALEAGESRAAALELVEEARYNLRQGQRRGHEHPRVCATLAVHGVPIEIRAAVLEAQIHHRTEIFCVGGPRGAEGRQGGRDCMFAICM